MEATAATSTTQAPTYSYRETEALQQHYKQSVNNSTRQVEWDVVLKISLVSTHYKKFSSASRNVKTCTQSMHKSSHDRGCHVNEMMKNSVFQYPNRGSSYPAASAERWSGCCQTNRQTVDGSLPCGPRASGWLLWGRARRCCWHQWTAVTSVWTWARTCQQIETRLILFSMSQGCNCLMAHHHEPKRTTHIISELLCSIYCSSLAFPPHGMNYEFMEPWGGFVLNIRR